MRDGLADESVGARHGAPIYGVAILESESDPVNELYSSSRWVTLSFLSLR